MGTDVYYHNPELRVDCYLIVPHVEEEKLLVCTEEDYCTLPHFCACEHASGAAGHINRWVDKELGLRAITLRHIGDEADDVHQRVVRLYLLENRNPHWQPPENCRWSPLGQLGEFDSARAGQRDKIAAALDELAQKDPPPERLPWSQRGWYDEANAWIDSRAVEADCKRRDPIEQVMVWEQSCVLRAHTARGDLYFKASPPMYTHETAITYALSQHDPQHMPAVLAADLDRRWLLMRDLGGQPLMRSTKKEHWFKALSTYAQLQIDSLPIAELLAANGLPDNRPQALIDGIEPSYPTPLMRL